MLLQRAVGRWLQFVGAERDELNRGLPVEAGVYHLTSRFGECSLLWSHCHTGLDFAAPSGTPIHAIAGGVVTSVGYDGSYGNKTVVTLEAGTELWYCHQNEFGTSVGATVKPGQVIGYVGSTGNVTGPHLHLEARLNGVPVDPMGYLTRSSAPAGGGVARWSNTVLRALALTGQPSSDGGSSVGGATSVISAPSAANALMSLRATRLCLTSPTIAMCLPDRLPRWWRIV